MYEIPVKEFTSWEQTFSFISNNSFGIELMTENGADESIIYHERSIIRKAKKNRNIVKIDLNPGLF